MSLSKTERWLSGGGGGRGSGSMAKTKKKKRSVCTHAAAEVDGVGGTGAQGSARGWPRMFACNG